MPPAKPPPTPQTVTLYKSCEGSIELPTSEERIFLWEVMAHFTPTKDIPDLLGSALANTQDGNGNDESRHRHQHPN